MEECTEFCRITARLAANKAKRDHESEGTVKEKKVMWMSTANRNAQLLLTQLLLLSIIRTFISLNH